MYLSNPVFLRTFPSGETKLIISFTFHLKFPMFGVNGKQPLCSRVVNETKDYISNEILGNRQTKFLLLRSVEETSLIGL